MTTSDNTEFTLPDFDLGSQAQINVASRIRKNYVEKMMDRGFDPVDIQIILHVRTVAKWWLDTQEKLIPTTFTRQLATAKALSTRSGSPEKAGQAQIESAKKKEADSELYRKLSQPMWKYVS